jgi:hypothetical protein
MKLVMPRNCLTLACVAVAAVGARLLAAPPEREAWRLVFSDEFNGQMADLDKQWEFQNGASRHFLCSRWRGNVVVENGLCWLLNRKEQRGGQQPRMKVLNQGFGGSMP